MDNPDALMRYQMAKIQTASTDELGLMLYEAALRATRECQQAIRREDWEQTVRQGSKAQDIFLGLAETVNPDHPQSDTMRGLYLYCWRTVAVVQTTHQADALDGVVSVLENLIRGLKRFVEKHHDPVAPSGEVMTVNFSG